MKKDFLGYLTLSAAALFLVSCWGVDKKDAPPPSGPPTPTQAEQVKEPAKDPRQEALDVVAETGKFMQHSLFLNQVTAKQMEILTALEEVDEISLEGAQFPDDALIHLTKFPKLKTLFLGSNSISDAAFEYVGQLRNLQYLHLNRATDFSAQGLENLGKLKELQLLNLAYTSVADSDLALLSGLKSLTILHLTGTHVSDQGLVHLSGLKNLKMLMLMFTTVSDQGLEHLQGLKKLEDLMLNDTQVTKKGAAMIQKMLPECQVTYGSLF